MKLKKSPVTLAKHDDFDWNVDKRNKITYSKDESDKLELTYEGTFKTLNDNEIINATIVGLTDTGVILNVGYKSDGLVSKTEFRDLEDLKVGMEVEVYVVSKEDGKGQLNLSRKSAKMMKAWEHIVDAYKNEIIVTGNIISKTKGGLIVEVFGIETFYRVLKSALNQSLIMMVTLVRKWNSKLLKSTKPLKMPLYRIKHLLKAISKLNVRKLSVNWKKVRYWKELLKTLQTSVHLSI